MFVGHYAAALAAKAAEPRAPLWAYVGACQLLDIGWSGLVIGGVEKLRIDPSLPGSGLDLYDMPFTHSLPGSLAISLAAALAARWAMRLPWRAAALIGLVVFSHWLLDLLVHRPDLELFPGGPKVGLGLWNLPGPELALEMGLVAIAAGAWTFQRRAQGRSLWPALGFLSALVVLQVVDEMGGGGGQPTGMALTALAAYLVATALAWLTERRPPGDATRPA
ncbi:hypothetical protein ACO2Q3_02525 [Caulobacter sp. KR2-114]|uniref:hypothetical protein n=1 Tax=Caulobacter sp. KR2-114 TaxID=3400912 RepID=UPI003C09C6CD